MKINQDSFQRSYLNLSGSPLKIQLPETFEELIVYYSPTDFNIELKWIILAIQHEVKENEKLKKMYEPYIINNTSIYLGNLKVSGDFYIDHPIYILGDLEVEGVIYGDIHCILVVGGSISCEGMLLCRTYIFALQNIKINQCAIFTTYGFLILGEKLFSPLYIQDDTYTIYDVKQDSIPIVESLIEKISSSYLFNQEDMNDPDFLNKIRSIVGSENITLTEEGYWAFDELFSLITNKNKIVK